MPAPPPSTLDKINFVRFYMSNTCDVPFIVYLEAGLGALKDAIISLLSFGLTDMVRAFFRPKGLRTRRHGRKGRRGKRRRELLPETAEMVAKRVPGAERVKNRRVSDGPRTLWVIDTFIQRILYYWLVVDVVIEFAYDFQMSILLDDRVTCSGIGRSCRLGNPETLLSGGWGATRFDNLQYEEKVTTTNGGFGVPAGLYRIVIAGKFRIAPGFIAPSTVALGLSRPIGTPGLAGTSSFKNVSPGGEVECIATANLWGPTGGIFLAFVDGSPVEFFDGVMFLLQMGE